MGVPSHEAHKLRNTDLQKYRIYRIYTEIQKKQSRLASLGSILTQVEENKTLFVVHNPLGQRLFFFQKFKSIWTL